jgi:hypothetical protein
VAADSSRFDSTSGEMAEGLESAELATVGFAKTHVKMVTNIMAKP